MIVRIVKMGFREDAIDDFICNFESNKHKIRNFEGCEFLELYRETKNSNIFFTYSYWNSEANLETYRESNLFKKVWTKTKPLFNIKPEAWSVDKVASLE